MDGREEFDFAAGDLLDDSYIPASARTGAASKRDVSPISDHGESETLEDRIQQPRSLDMRERRERLSSLIDLSDQISHLNVSPQLQNGSRMNGAQNQPAHRNNKTFLANTSPREREVRNPSRSFSGNARVVLAIDYGTTFTGCAVAVTESGRVELDKIEVLQSWQGGNSQKVRSIISYAKSATDNVQWGASISDGVSAMVNTKLELEQQSSRLAELELTWNLLKGTGNLAFEHLKTIGPEPAYTSKPPGEIVKDYLTRICKTVCEPKSFKYVKLMEMAGTNTPLDIVVTVPAKWSMQATDATFKAIRGAGFNKTTFPTLKNTILVSEPEAAAHFAIIDHQATTKIDLRPDDCFIVCDAGGGTVDVVSYQVKKTSPELELERATDPDSGKCGSAFIDTAFKEWLRNLLGEDLYVELDPINGRDRLSVHAMESGSMRTLMKQFIEKKHTFDGNTSDMKLDLEKPLDELAIEGKLKEGQLTINRDELEDMFSVGINGVIDLIDEQFAKLRKYKNRKPRDVFLVGGFGASLWLQEQLTESLDEFRGSTLRRPNKDKSVTAVVQGAVIYGIEKARHKDIKYMSAVTDSYGILVDGRFEWLVRRGDLVLSTEKRNIRSKFFYLPLKSCPSLKYELVLYHYKKREDDDDNVPTLWEDGQHEVERAGTVKCDFTSFLHRDLHNVVDNRQTRDTRIGPLSCHLELSEDTLTIEVLFRKTVLRGAHAEINIRTDAQRSQGRPF